MRGTLALITAFLGTASVSAQTTTAPPPAPSPTPRVLTAPLPMPAPIFSRPSTPFPSAAFVGSRYYADLYQNVLDYGRCAVHVSPDRSQRLLDANPNTPTERVETRQLRGISRGCLPYGYSAPVVFLRAGLAEALYKEAVPRGELRTEGLSTLFVDERVRDRTRLADDRLFTRVAICMVTRAPLSVDRLLRTTPGSSAERAALNETVEKSAVCARGTRLPSVGGSAIIRAYLAESAYRLAVG